MVALFASVLAGGLAELGDQCLLDVGEPGVVAGADVELELVGHDTTSFDVDRALIVHLAHEPPTELDRPDAGLRNTQTRPRPYALHHAQTTASPFGTQITGVW